MSDGLHVRRVAANWIVASVINFQTRWNRAVSKLVGKAIRLVLLAVRQFNLAVAFVRATLERPTLIGSAFVNFGVKTFVKRLQLLPLLLAYVANKSNVVK
jgi:peptide subunit release factor RF-3